MCGALTLSCVTLPRKEVLAVRGGAVSSPTRFVNSAQLDINRAAAGELEHLPGVGAVLARRIVEHRERYGRFRRAEHLLMVRGMSERRFTALHPLIEARP